MEFHYFGLGITNAMAKHIEDLDNLISQYEDHRRISRNQPLSAQDLGINSYKNIQEFYVFDSPEIRDELFQRICDEFKGEIKWTLQGVIER